MALYLPNGGIALSSKQAQNILPISPGENHGSTLTNHHRQGVDADGSALSSNDDPVSIAILDLLPATDRRLGIGEPTGVISWIALCATPYFEWANSVKAISVTFSVVPKPDFRPHMRPSPEYEGAPIDNGTNLGLWK